MISEDAFNDIAQELIDMGVPEDAIQQLVEKHHDLVTTRMSQYRSGAYIATEIYNLESHASSDHNSVVPEDDDDDEDEEEDDD